MQKRRLLNFSQIKTNLDGPMWVKEAVLRFHKCTHAFLDTGNCFMA
jgi:hypothetical protein